MTTWKSEKLGRLVSFTSGGTPSKRNDSYWNGDIPWISAKTMKSDRIGTSEVYITEEGLANGSKLAEVGSLLLLVRGSGLFNGIPVCYVVSPVAYNQDVKCINSRSEVENEYIYYWLKANSDYLRAKLEVTGIGAGKFDTKFLSELDVAYPEQETRRKIIDFANNLTDKIQVNQAINRNLEEQIVTNYRSWFLSFEHFSDTLEEGELGKQPIGWKVVALKEVTENIRDRVKDDVDSVKVLSAINTGKLILSEEYFTKQVFSKDISKYILVEKNDFAYNPARVNIGSIGINDLGIRGCVSPVYVVVRTEKGYENFLRYFLYTDRFKIEVITRASGSVRQAMSYTDFALIKVIYPPKDVIDEFNEMISPLQIAIKHTQIENANLVELRDSILPKLMSGELDVSEIDI